MSQQPTAATTTRQLNHIVLSTDDVNNQGSLHNPNAA
jgi:hypothetical protein